MGDPNVTDAYAGVVLEGKYKLIEKLGEGGMGCVYLGIHQFIGKKVAVKFLHREYAANQELIARFYREARAAAEIGHRSIIDVLDMGVSPQGEPYLVMEYLEGESLGAMLRRNGPLDLGTVCGIMEQALLALQAAHEKGIVHRDLKPENIFFSIREGEIPTIKLIDFGISKITHESRDTKLTQTGSLLGTPSYMSPEQARGDAEIDYRSDLYSIGVVFYQMLTGALPFEGTNYNRLIIKVLTEPPRPPSQANPAFPKEAEPIVNTALAKGRDDRYQSALEMLEALRRVSVFGSRTERLSMAAIGIKQSTMTTAALSRFGENDSGRALVAAVFDRVSGGAAHTPPTPPGTVQVPATGFATRTSERRPPTIYAESTTPGAWSTELPAEKSTKSSTITYLLIGVASVAAALAVVVGVGYWGFLRGHNEGAATKSTLSPAPILNPAPVTMQPVNATVSIAVEGAPSGAKIYFDGAHVGDNPFIVRKETVFLPLVVEAEGYEPYKIRISTERDQTVKVSLKPVWRNVGGQPIESPETAQEDQVIAPQVREVRRPATPARSPATPRREVSSPEKPSSRVQKASRGTNLAEDFE